MWTKAHSVLARWHWIEALVLAMLACRGTAAAQERAVRHEQAPAARASAPEQATSAKTSQASPMQDSPAKKAAADALRDVAGDPAAHASAEVSYQVGIETWRGGKTTVRVRGDGQVTVSNRSGKKERSFTAKLGAKELKAVLNTLVQHRFTEQRSTRKTGNPDEARMMLSFLEPATGTDVKSELWDNERWEKPDLKAIVARFQKLMNEVSKGAIRY